VRSSESALAFLKQHQPMPEDAALDEDLIRRFDEVRRHFEEHPDPRCVPLFIGALRSDSSGFGVYQLLDGLLAVHDQDIVVEALRAALRSPTAARSWAMEFACDYGDDELKQIAEGLLDDHDEDVRYWARAYVDEFYELSVRRGGRSRPP
jgi:hypothetical protein